jgi:hypothetical protein
MMRWSDYKIYALALAAAVCVFYLLTLRQGQTWMDDYAQYVLHAASIAEGRPYADTGYVINPSYPATGPETYPPVFPLMLAAVHLSAGPHLRAMKGVTVAAFSAFLFVLFLLFRARLGDPGALLVAGLVGFSPVFWKFKDYLYSEYPFLLFSFAALYVYGRSRAAEDAGRGWLPRALAAGLLAYLAYGTRSAGALLPAAFLAADIAELKKPSRTFYVCCAAALFPAAVQWLVVHSDAAYANVACESFSGASLAGIIGGNILYYADSFTLYFENGYFSVLPALLLAGVSCLAAYGFVLRVAVEPLFAAYVLLNSALVLALPRADILRYAFPLVPFLFYYALAGWELLRPRLGRAARYAGPVLLLLVLVSYAGWYSTARYGRFSEGTDKHETIQLFDYVRREVPPSDIVVFRKPRTLALHTGRRSSMYHFGADSELLSYFNEVGAGYLVTGGVFPEDKAFLIPFVERNKGRFTEAYSNSDFTVYKID